MKKKYDIVIRNFLPEAGRYIAWKIHFGVLYLVNLTTNTDIDGCSIMIKTGKSKITKIKHYY